MGNTIKKKSYRPVILPDPTVVNSYERSQSSQKNQPQPTIDSLPKSTEDSAKLVGTIRTLNKTPLKDMRTNSNENETNASKKENESKETIEREIAKRLLKRRSSKPIAPKRPPIAHHKWFVKEDDEKQEELGDNDDMQELSRKKDELLEHVTSLTRLEFDQKLKILEQQRQLQVQNAKLEDALLVKESLDTFDYAKLNDFESIYDYPLTKLRPISQFKPKSIVTQYEPIENSFSTLDSNGSSHPYDIFLNTYEDLLDESGQTLISNRSKMLQGKIKFPDNKGSQHNILQKAIKTQAADLIEVPHRPPHRSASNAAELKNKLKNNLHVELQSNSSTSQQKRHSMMSDDRYSFTISRDMYLRCQKSKMSKKNDDDNDDPIKSEIKDDSLENINYKLKLINQYSNQSNDSTSTLYSKQSENALVETINGNFFDKLSQRVPELVDTNNFQIMNASTKRTSPKLLSEFVANDAQSNKSNTKI